MMKRVVRAIMRIVDYRSNFSLVLEAWVLTKKEPLCIRTPFIVGYRWLVANILVPYAPNCWLPRLGCMQDTAKPPHGCLQRHALSSRHVQFPHGN